MSILVSNGPEQTRAIAASLLKKLEPGSVLSLHGELGSGKTCFVQGLADALGVTQAVASPTYTLINEYIGRMPLYHIDLYRLSSVADAVALGIEDYFDSEGITVVEWGERADELFPPRAIHITFEHGRAPDVRRIGIKPLEPGRNVTSAVEI